jgi:hypothetical protein
MLTEDARGGGVDVALVDDEDKSLAQVCQAFIIATMPNNFAFIDGQNVHLGIRALGWRIDWKRFRVHLRESYGVTRAYYFIGYVPENQGLYRDLQSRGYIVIFKPVTYQAEGKPKGNVDAELVLQAMIDFPEYEKAVIVTNDGDFHCLVRYLAEKGKLGRVLSPNRAWCSALLKRAAGPRIDFLEAARAKLEFRKVEGEPRQDTT